MAKFLHGLLITFLILLAILGTGAAYVVKTHHLSFDTAGNNLLILKNSPNLTIKPKVLRTIPRAGIILDDLRKPGGLVALIYFPALLITLYEIKHLAQRRLPQPYQPRSEHR